VRPPSQTTIESFILSGYPLDDEAGRVAELLLPRLELGYID